MSASKAQCSGKAATSEKSPEEQESVLWKKNIVTIMEQLKQVPSGTDDLPPELLGQVLSPQTFSTPVKSWVDGVFRTETKSGASVPITLPQASGMFVWTKNAEDDLKSRKPLTTVPLPDPQKLEIKRMVYFVESNSGVRIPWNTGLQGQMNGGYLVHYHGGSAKVIQRFWSSRLRPFCQILTRSLG